MIPLSLSYGSSSGVNGDTKSGPIADYYFAAPFAVGSGASATSDQAGGGAGGLSLPMILLGGLALVLGLFALTRRNG